MERREKKSPYVRQQLQEACGGACGGGALPVIASNFEWVQSEKFLPNVSRGVEGRVDWRGRSSSSKGGGLPLSDSVRYHLDASLLDASSLESADT